MKLIIPDEFLDNIDRTDRLIKASAMYGFKRRIQNKVFKNAMEVATRYGCRDYKRKDWERIAKTSSECLNYSVANMSVNYGLDLSSIEIITVSTSIRLAAGRYLAYS